MAGRPSLKPRKTLATPSLPPLALRLGKEKFYSYLEAFGFGARSGIDFSR